MKKITFSRKQILHAIHAACVALFFAACAGQAKAGPPSVNSPEYTIGASTSNGITVTGQGNNSTSAYFLQAGGAGYQISIAPGANLGNSTKYDDDEIEIDHGGVYNAGSLSASHYAVYIYNNGTVTNSGSIHGSSAGVYIDGTGTVTNQSTGSISGKYGVELSTGTVNNLGGSISGKYGIDIFSNGTVLNTDGGSISGKYGIYFDGTGTVTNTDGGTISGKYGVYLSDVGTVNNSNGGTISGKYGVYLNDGGTVNNLSGGSISGYKPVYLDDPGTVTNAGSISGSYAVIIQGDGTVTNSNYIRAYDDTAIIINGNGTVTNSGYIAGDEDGIDISGNGTVINTGSIYDAAGGVAVNIGGNGIVNNTDLISGSYDGVRIGGTGTVTNSGTISATAGNGAGVYFAGVGSVYNSGSIYDNNATDATGVFLESGGTIGNSGLIAAGDNAIISLGNATVNNSGTIVGTNGFGIIVDGNATINNTGAITGGSFYGIVVYDQANITLAGGSVTGGLNTAVDVNYTGAGAASTITVIGRTSLTGQLVSSGPTGTLNLNLVGLTPAKLAQLAALNGSTANTFVLGPNTYQWTNLTLVDNAISLEQHVDPGLVGAATAFDNATSTTGLPAGYDPVYAAAYANPEAALNELVGREINQGLDTIGLNIATTLASDLNEHLDNILTGNQIGGFDIGGLHVSNAGSMYAMGDTTSQLESLLHMTGSDVLGGTEMSTDTKAMVASAPPPSWGVWASGNVTLGDESGQNTLSNFHSTLGSPTLGFDYRVCPNLVLGILGSYTTGDANFGDGSKIGSNVELAALYGTWRDGNWHVNGIAGGGSSQFNDHRTTFGGLTANSSPRGDDIITDFTGGYDFHLGDRWNVTPEVGLQYTHLDIDSFSESGAGLFDLNVGSQNIDSLRSHVGFKVDKAYSLGKDLTVIPEVRALWYHEFLDDSRGVATSLPGTPALGSFSVNTFSPQRDFALVGAGLNTAFTGYKGVPVGLFLNYNCQVGQDDYIANSVNAGIRVDF
jgi:outer membrane autotransporter protein